MEAIDAFLGGKDVMAVLPTGFGKSMIYQSFIRIKDLRSEDSSDNYSTSCLVIVPLKSIIEEQVKSNDFSLKAVAFNESV